MLRPLFLWAWNRTKKDHPIEGIVPPYARAIKQAVGITVICTGGFQDAGLIRKVASDGTCDAVVSIGRPLVANNDLPLLIKEKQEIAQPCTFCNRCLVNAVYNPLGCYDVTRFDYDQRAIIDEAMRVFDPSRKPYVYFMSGPRVLRGKTYSIKAMGVTFIDLVRNSPVDCWGLRFRRRLLVVASVALLVVLALGFPSFWR